MHASKAFLFKLLVHLRDFVVVVLMVVVDFRCSYTNYLIYV